MEMYFCQGKSNFVLKSTDCLEMRKKKKGQTKKLKRENLPCIENVVQMEWIDYKVFFKALIWIMYLCKTKI